VSFDEIPLVYQCEGESLVAIVARPDGETRIGVLIVVGGPQYRVGSHRQFVHLSRYLAAHGVACMRFDCRGMGDSTGPMRSFDSFSADIRGAIDLFVATVPGLRSVFAWGLCDAASALCFYAPSDARLEGVVLVNPWVRTEAGEAATYLRHYYVRRILDASFWKKLATGQFSLAKSLRSFVTLAGRVAGSKGATASDGAAAQSRQALPERMASALGKYRKQVLLIMSGDDYTAAEFKDVSNSSSAWRAALSAERTHWEYLPEANHTFSSQAWKDHVADVTGRWVKASGKAA
jgi:exosortase A-associated hydrolase 1